MKPRDVVTVLVAVVVLIVVGVWIGGKLGGDDSDDAIEVAGPAAGSTAAPAPETEETGPLKSLEGDGFSVDYPAAFEPVSVDDESFPLGQVTALTERGGEAVGIDNDNWIAAYPFPVSRALAEGLRLPAKPGQDTAERIRIEGLMHSYGRTLSERIAAGARREFGMEVEAEDLFTEVDGAPAIEVTFSYPGSDGPSRIQIIQAFGQTAGLVLVANFSEGGESEDAISSAFQNAIGSAELGS